MCLRRQNGIAKKICGDAAIKAGGAPRLNGPFAISRAEKALLHTLDSRVTRRLFCGKTAESGPSSAPGGRGSAGGAGGPTESTYLMEHLATFTVTKETGIVYPADGMRRLLQLEKSNGIWSQKMQLRLERNWVLIMDNETGVI